METYKRYEIKTIQELADIVTLENVENLAIDVKNFLMAIAEAREIFGVKIECEKLVWIDDKKHNETINIRIDLEERQGDISSSGEDKLKESKNEGT